ncbi:outer membrane beta-barrel protein [Empedobacter brevis]|uniref:outer membrane beta-barrel protein n=1 Tax=Empedobacter brevis TaxID=247 RepID=UPI002FE30F13
MTRTPVISFLPVLCLVLLNGNVSAQESFNLRGKVVNNSNHSMEFVQVSLIKNDSITVSQTITDSLGIFSLNGEKGSYVLLMEQFGAELFAEPVALFQDIDLAIIQIDEFQQLEEVVIEGKRKIIEKVGDKLYFNVENSLLATGNSGLDILQKSPKLSTTSDGVLLRNKSVSILVNGRKLNLSGGDLTAYLSSLSSEDIKRIEIQDVASADQDGSADGGVVNIVLKKSEKGIRGIVKTYFHHRKENYNAYNGALNLNYGTEKWNIYSDISYSDSKDFGHTESAFNYFNGRRNYEKGQFDQNNDNLGIRIGSTFYPNSKNELGFEGYYNKNTTTFDNSGIMNITDNGSPLLSSTNTSLSNTKNDFWYLTFNYSYLLDDEGSYLKFIGDIGQNKSNPSNNVLIEYPENSDLNNHYLFDTRANSRYATSQLDWVQKLENKWDINAGLKFMYVKRDNLLDVQFNRDNVWFPDLNQNQDFNNKEQIFAGYVSFSKTFEKQYIKFGLRAENTNIKGINNVTNSEVRQDYTQLFPSLYYRYNIDESNKSIALNYRRSIARPSFSDLNPFVIKINDYLYQIGNPDLKPLYMNRMDITFDVKKHSFSLFGKLTDKTIQGVYFTDEQNVNYYQPQNFGKYKEAGFDHSFSGNITKWFYADVSTGVFYNSFRSNDGLTNQGPSFYNNTYLQFKPAESYIIEVFSNYQHRYKSRNLENRYKYKFDISLGKSFLNNTITTRLIVYDVFNTRFDENTSYYQDFNFNFYQKRLTRGVLLYVQYTFGNKHKVSSKTVKSENESRGRL